MNSDQWLFIGITMLFFAGGAIVGAFFATRGFQRVLCEMIEEAANKDDEG